MVQWHDVVFGTVVKQFGGYGFWNNSKFGGVVFDFTGVYGFGVECDLLARQNLLQQGCTGTTFGIRGQMQSVGDCGVFFGFAGVGWEASLVVHWVHGASSLRCVARVLNREVCALDLDTMGRSRGVAKPAQYAQPLSGMNREVWDHRGRAESKTHRHRKQSSSSSTSRERARARKMKKASQLLYKGDVAYKSFVDGQKKDAEETQLRAQGEALATAMRASFEESLKAVATSQQQQQQHLQQQVAAAATASPSSDGSGQFSMAASPSLPPFAWQHSHSGILPQHVLMQPLPSVWLQSQSLGTSHHGAFPQQVQQPTQQQQQHPAFPNQMTSLMGAIPQQ
eukprot:1333925-Amphidinium_carterae.2